MPAPTASDITPSLVNGDPMDMLSHLRTESLSPVDSGGASVSVAAEERATHPPPSTPAEDVGDSSVAIHIPSGETSSCPNVAWGGSLEETPSNQFGHGGWAAGGGDAAETR